MEIKYRMLENFMTFFYIVEYEMLKFDMNFMIMIFIFSEVRNFAYLFVQVADDPGSTDQKLYIYNYISQVVMFYTFMDQYTLIIFIIVIIWMAMFSIGFQVLRLSIDLEYQKSLNSRKEYIQLKSQLIIVNYLISTYFQLYDLFLENIILTTILLNFKQSHYTEGIICLVPHLFMQLIRMYIQNSVCFIIPNNFHQHKYGYLGLFIRKLNIVQILLFSLSAHPIELQIIITLLIGLLKIYDVFLNNSQLIPNFEKIIIIIQTSTIVIAVAKLITLNITTNYFEFEIITCILSSLFVQFICQMYWKNLISLLNNKQLSSSQLIKIISYIESVKQTPTRKNQIIECLIMKQHMRVNHNGLAICKCKQDHIIKNLLNQITSILEQSNRNAKSEQILYILMKMYTREHIYAYIHASKLITGKIDQYSTQTLNDNISAQKAFQNNRQQKNRIQFQKIFLENIKVICQKEMLKMLENHTQVQNNLINSENIVGSDVIKLELQFILKQSIQAKINFIKSLIDDASHNFQIAIKILHQNRDRLTELNKQVGTSQTQQTLIFFYAEIMQDITTAYLLNKKLISKQLKFGIKEEEAVFILCETIEQSFQMKIVQNSSQALRFFGIPKFPPTIVPLLPHGVRDHHDYLVEKFLRNGNPFRYKQATKYYGYLTNSQIVSVDAYVDVLFSNDQLQFLVIFYGRADTDVTLIVSSQQQIVGVNSYFFSQFEIDVQLLPQVYELPIQALIKDFNEFGQFLDSQVVNIVIPKFKNSKTLEKKFIGNMDVEVRMNQDNNTVMYYIINICNIIQAYKSQTSQQECFTQYPVENYLNLDLSKIESHPIVPYNFDEEGIFTARASQNQQLIFQLESEQMVQQVNAEKYRISMDNIQQESSGQQGILNQMDNDRSSIFSKHIIESQFQRKYDLINKLTTKPPKHSILRNLLISIILSCVIQIIALTILTIDTQSKISQFNQNYELISIKDIVIQPIVQCQLLRIQIYNYKYLYGLQLITQAQLTQATKFCLSNLGYVQKVFQITLQQLTSNYYFSYHYAGIYVDAYYDATNASIRQNYTYRNLLNTMLELQQEITAIFVSGSIPNTALPYSQYQFRTYGFIYNQTETFAKSSYSILNNLLDLYSQQQIIFFIIISICSFVFLFMSATYYIQHSRQQLDILSNLVKPDLMTYKSELQHFRDLLDQCNDLSSVKYQFNIEVKEQQILSSQPKCELQSTKLTHVKTKSNSLKVFLMYLTLSLLILIGSIIQTIYIESFNNLAYFTGSVYNKRDFIYLNPLTKVLTPNLQIFYLREIISGLQFISNYSNNPPSMSNMLVSQSFIDNNLTLAQFNMCTIALPGVVGYQQICQEALSGILNLGLTQTLAHIVNTLNQEMVLNNFTSRPLQQSIDLPGAFILSEILNNINKAVILEGQSYSQNYQNYIILIAILFIIILVIIIKVSFYVVYNRLGQEMQRTLQFIYLMPLTTLFHDDSFERRVRKFILYNDQI